MDQEVSRAHNFGAAPFHKSDQSACRCTPQFLPQTRPGVAIGRRTVLLTRLGVGQTGMGSVWA